MTARRLVIALSALLVMAAAPPAPAADPRFAAFDQSIAATKSAMMADPQQALDRAEQALRLAAALPSSPRAEIARATAQWLEAEALLFLNAPDRARPIVDQAIATVVRAAPDTKLHGDLLRSRGAIAASSGRVQEALKNFQDGYEIFRRAGEKRSQAIALQDIGEIYRDAGDYDRVLQYYAQSAEVFHDDPALLLTTHNNRAQVFRELKRYPAAVVEYRAALVDAQKLKSTLLESRILTNLAWVQVDAGQVAAAERSAAQAYRLSLAGEARGWQPFVFGVMAKVAAARGDDAGAARLLERMFAGQDLATTRMPYREFHELAARVYEKIGREDLAFAHLRAFQRLDSEAQKLTASTNAQLMAATFDSKNQKLAISQLKADQLERANVIEHQRTLIYQGVVVAVSIVLGLLLFGFLKIRRSRDQVRAANDNLSDANGKLGKALKAKTEFLATTSHEIRTPLNGILGMTQVLLADRRVDAETRSKIEVVHGAGEAMKALVDDILDVAKMETGEVTVVRGETDLHAILSESARLWSGQADTKGVALALAADDAPPRIVSDAGRLRQIVFNLMSNATKFTLQGTVELAAYAEPGPDGETLVIRVSDTGIGIPADAHEIIFEPFRQVDTGTTRQFGGTGLGLSICRRLTTALGGTIAVESEPGRGSVFTVRLPLERVAAPAPHRDRSDADERLRTEAAGLLLVERNILTQSILRTLLAPAFPKVDLVASGGEALAAIAAGTVRHVLVEAGSADPGGDAVEALRRIAAAARARGTACTVLFTPSDALQMVELIEIGATRVIAKPIDGAGLLAALAQDDAAAGEPNSQRSDAA